MKLLLHGLNFSPEQIGIGKYSGEMVQALAEAGHDVVVVTTPPYYPQWKIAEGFRGAWYRRVSSGGEKLAVGSRQLAETEESAGSRDSDSSLPTANCPLPTPSSPSCVEVIRCPLWVPRKVSGLKRVLHLATFGLSSIPVVLWQAIRFRPDVIMTVEPAAFCMPTTLIAAKLCGAKTWLHVQDFEIDAAFELGIIRQPLLKKIMLGVEGFLMRRFDRASSISPNMLLKLFQKGVAEDHVVAFPNWVDCDEMKPLHATDLPLDGDHAENLADDSSGYLPSDDRVFMEQLRAGFGIPRGKCVALYAGNIGAKQGLEIIIDVARRKSTPDDLHFVICGRGAAYDVLHQAAQGLSNVQFLPVQPFEKFNELMNCADIHLLPQKGDAADLVMPSKLTGMLATGRPIVACASAGTQIADVVQGHGIVVPPADNDAFGAAIVTLAQDEDLRKRLGVKARQYAVDHLGRDAILGRFIDDLRELCGHVVVPAVIPAGRVSSISCRIDGQQGGPVGTRGKAADSVPAAR